jgi:hypothetical protein
MKELFGASKLNVTEGKRIQRKIRYEKLKNEFQQLIINMTSAAKQQEPATLNNKSLEVELIQTQMEKERQEYGRRVDQYKD